MLRQLLLLLLLLLVNERRGVSRVLQRRLLLTIGRLRDRRLARLRVLHQREVRVGSKRNAALLLQLLLL